MVVSGKEGEERNEREGFNCIISILFLSDGKMLTSVSLGSGYMGL